jgi:RNA polymerase sigma-70 factor (ECF subfamily)
MAPMDLMEKRELRELLESLIEKLPVSQRAALELQRGQGFSYREISESLGLSTMAVKSLLVRARENLKNGVKRYLQAEKDNDP